ncbi:MAG: dTDP-4-dehydrorhamnose reductase [Bacteroidota bacterium]|nr:dTDP-4-dehydrorhamnose reductase [Bacteroidota bacterium]
MKTILITGANGQLGMSIRKISKNYDFDFIFTDYEELDITNKEALELFFSQNNISFVINTAAYTAVDKAEQEKEKCSLVNDYAVENLAKVCQSNGTFFIHVSTDYVFDGKTCRPYFPEDKPQPINVYGQSKLEGENKALSFCENSIVVRTSGVYSEFGKNFVKTMLNLCAEKPELRVVYDQVMSPCYATDLAECLMDIVTKISKEGMPKKEYRLLHYSNEGILSWYDFAKKINDLANLKCKIIPILAKDYPTLAVRPNFSVLDKGLTKEYLNKSIAHWEDALKECLKHLIS